MSAIPRSPVLPNLNKVDQKKAYFVQFLMNFENVIKI